MDDHTNFRHLLGEKMDYPTTLDRLIGEERYVSDASGVNGPRFFNFTGFVLFFRDTPRDYFHLKTCISDWKFPVTPTYEEKSGYVGRIPMYEIQNGDSIRFPRELLAEIKPGDAIILSTQKMAELCLFKDHEHVRELVDRGVGFFTFIESGIPTLVSGFKNIIGLTKYPF